MPNTDKPILSCPEAQSHLKANKTTSRNKINNGNSHPQVQKRRLQNKRHPRTLKCQFLKEQN